LKSAPISEDEKRRLSVEIFELTGHKVDADDPLIAAAFFYSVLLRRAGDDHRQAIDEILRTAEKRLISVADVTTGKVQAEFKLTLAAVTSELRDASLASRRAAGIEGGLNERPAAAALQRQTDAVVKVGYMNVRALVGSALLIAIAAFVSGALWAPAFRGDTSQPITPALKSGYSGIADMTKQKSNDELKRHERTPR
jgi:hypothetical protein